MQRCAEHLPNWWGDAHPSYPVTAQVSLLSHQEAQQPQCNCSWISFQTFLLKQTFLYLPAWKFYLCHFHGLADSEETARQSPCKDSGCRRQQSAGDYGWVMALYLFLSLHPAYLIFFLCTRDAAPGTHEAWAVSQKSWPNHSQIPERKL